MRCNTKYPIFLIHGAGFRDRKHLSYWGRIPAALESEGAVVFYGNQDAWGSVEANAETLALALDEYIARTDCGKVNIIAHSKGGIEARYLISTLGRADKVASLTTLAALHNGSKTIDLFCRFPAFLYKAAAFFTNIFFRLLGDKHPDFYNGSRHLSTASMREFNARNPDCEGVYYQSYAAVMNNPFSDIFLFWPNVVVGLIEGENDGLVTPESARWTNFRGVLRGTTNRGISHADEVDARRMNFTKKQSDTGISDIREFYTDVAAGLKAMGL